MADILVLGGKGQVGLMLQRVTWPDGMVLHAPDRNVLDLADPIAIAAIINERAWSLVINAAAYTAVDQAEDDVASAWTINALAPAVLARETAKAGIPLIHISTDYVFDGTNLSPYTEADCVAPIGVYGASKEGGEQGVRTGNPHHVIIRTAWVYGPDRANFVKTMLRVGRGRDEMSVVADQHGNPTATRDIADAIVKILIAILAGNAHWGTYHLAGTGDATWHDLAQATFEAASSADNNCWDTVPKVHPIPASQYPTPAARPANSRLDCTKLSRDYGIRTQFWRDALTETVHTLVADSNEKG